MLWNEFWLKLYLMLRGEWVNIYVVLKWLRDIGGKKFILVNLKW